MNLVFIHPILSAAPEREVPVRNESSKNLAVEYVEHSSDFDQTLLDLKDHFDPSNLHFSLQSYEKVMMHALFCLALHKVQCLDSPRKLLTILDYARMDLQLIERESMDYINLLMDTFEDRFEAQLQSLDKAKSQLLRKKHLNVSELYHDFRHYHMALSQLMLSCETYQTFIKLGDELIVRFKHEMPSVEESSDKLMPPIIEQIHEAQLKISAQYVQLITTFESDLLRLKERFANMTHIVALEKRNLEACTEHFFDAINSLDPHGKELFKLLKTSSDSPDKSGEFVATTHDDHLIEYMIEYTSNHPCPKPLKSRLQTLSMSAMGTLGNQEIKVKQGVMSPQHHATEELPREDDQPSWKIRAFAICNIFLQLGVAFIPRMDISPSKQSGSDSKKESAIARDISFIGSILTDKLAQLKKLSEEQFLKLTRRHARTRLILNIYRKATKDRFERDELLEIYDRYRLTASMPS